MKNQTLLQGLQAAMKAIGVSDFGDSVLQPGKLARFVRKMRRPTVVLPEANFMRMMSNKEDIDRIGFTGRVITETKTGDGTKKGDETTAKPSRKTNQLVACEFRGKTGIADRALRRNIERGGFENTLIDMFGEASGIDVEEIGMLGDKTHPTDAFLQTTDGWLEKAGTKLEDVDDSAANWPLNLFDAMIAAMPKAYWRNVGSFRFYVPWAVSKAYRQLHVERKYNLSDQVLTQGTLPPYEGVPISVVPALDGSTLYSTASLLANPANMVWGLFHETTIEPKRKPEDRETEFYLTLEGDFHYENEDAAVASFIEHS